MHSFRAGRRESFGATSCGKREFLGVCNIDGARCRDWEDIAIGPGPDPNQHYLYIGDIGDNRGEYREIVVYRVPEPRVGAAAPFEPMTAGL